MAGALGFLSGLVRGVADTAKENRDRMEREEFKKVQIKLFKHDLEQKEQVDLAKQQVFKLFQGFQTPTQTDDLGLGQAQTTGQAPKRKSLMDILADPEGQMALMQSGMMKPADILQSQRPSMEEVLKKFTGGGSGAGGGGMELSGIKIGTNGQITPDLSRPKFKTEVPSGAGMSMTRLDEYGREMGRRPMGPGEKKPLERSKGQTAIDTKFAEEYVAFKAAGGYADIEKQLEQLRETSLALGTESGLTGGLIPGISPGMTPEAVLKRTNPRAIEIRDNVLDSAQRNLRLVLGAQFTEREGEKLLSRVYDIALKQAQNQKRVERLITQIQSAAKAKQEAIKYFEDNGTLEGFKGKLWTLADFDPEPMKPKPSLKGPGKTGKQEDPLGLR